MELMLPFNKELFQTLLIKNRIFGKKLFFFKKAKSTNEIALKLAYRGFPEGTIIVAEGQTYGKGQNKKYWFSPSGKNIYTTIILRPKLEFQKFLRLTLVAGIAVADVLQQYCKKKIYLKWPNDVYIGEYKICGILSESRNFQLQNKNYIVIGIGININSSYNEFLFNKLGNIATSLRIETGFFFDREEILAKVYEYFEKWYVVFCKLGFSQIFEKWHFYLKR